jgi:hypothetical protein
VPLPPCGSPPGLGAEKQKQQWFEVAAGGGALGGGATVLAQFEQRWLLGFRMSAALLLPQFDDVTPQMPLAVAWEASSSLSAL